MNAPLTSPATNSGRSTVYAPNGVVATSQPLATSAGLRMLFRGGTAVDAAIAAAAVLSVVEPHMTGIGGDAFALLWIGKERRLVAMSAAGRAGSLMTRDEILRRGHTRAPQQGAESVTVPGALAGWSALLERYGRFSLAEVLEPAIALAEDGFPVSPVIAGDWATQTDKLRSDPGSAATFLRRTGRPPGAGEWFRNPALARSLRAIADQGAAVLYEGDLGRKLIRGLRPLGGFISEGDMERAKVDWTEPIHASFLGTTVYELPPPNQGIAALQMLRILDGLDLRGLGHNTADYLHHLVEAKKLSFADLSGHISDPSSMSRTVDQLLDEGYIEARRRAIHPERAASPVSAGAAASGGDTICLAAADGEGNMISFINSIFGHFGSGVTIEDTGFPLQNRGAGFTLQVGHPNMVAPAKVPLHTLMPGFVTRHTAGGEEPWLAFGVMGGGMQPQGQVQVLLNILLFGMDLQEANDAARFQHFEGTRVGLEDPIGDTVLRQLRHFGHETRSGGAFGGCQMVARLPRGWAASSDVRKDGHAAGF